MKSQEVFQRVEKKYLLTEEQYQAWKKVMADYMTLDQFGDHNTINTIYFDTDDYSLIRRSLQKPLYKEKFRLRGYGKVTEASPVFAEIKKKYMGIVYKRRQVITVPEAKNWLYKGRPAPLNTQIAREIEYMLDLYRPSPKVYIGYEREAYFGNEDHNLRLTIDSNLRFRTTNLELTKGSWGQPLLDEPLHLMEIKIPQALPMWMVKTMEELGIRPTSFSKYGTYYRRFVEGREARKIIDFKEASVC